jgi:hypothetical protein
VRSEPAPRLPALLLAGALLVAACNGAAAADLPTRAQVQAAAEAVRADPNLGGTRTEKTLRFKERDAPEPKDKPDALQLGWLRNLIEAVTEGARVLVWVLGALAVALLIVSARRFVKLRAGGGRLRRAPLPSHVGALDIRPESLPDDIGNAAAALWQRGQQRAALSLLYRGALSRLVHVQAMPIRAASTEGECVALAARQLDAPAQAFFTRLVDAWQLAAYGGRLPATAAVLALCAGFDTHLPAAAPPAAANAVAA